MFQRDFPKIGVLRHAIAHRVELKSKTQRNAFRGAITRNKNISMEKGAILFMSQCFEDDTYVVTRSGERLTFEMSSQNYMKLLAMYEKCMSDLAGH